ncbi:unnamed protein product [Closterium sp. NIES-54]
MTSQGASGLGNPRGDEEAAAFFWVPFGAGVSAAKSIAADIKGRIVFTGHRDGRVLVWKVQERGTHRVGAAAGEGSAQGSSSSTGEQGERVEERGQRAKSEGGATTGRDDRSGGGGEKEPGWKVWAELVAEWQAHSTTVTALAVTSYGELWSAGDRGVIKAWPWPSLCSELSRASSSPSPAPMPPTVPVSSAAPLRAPCVIRPAAVPVLLHAASCNVQVPRNRVVVASASAAAAAAAAATPSDDGDDSKATGGAGGSTAVTATESSGSGSGSGSVAAAAGGSGGGGGGSSAAAGTGVEYEGGSGGVVYGVTSVRRLVSDPATGQVWSIGAASISIWDAGKRALVCHVKVKDEERAAADTSSGAVASGASNATAATANSATAPGNAAPGTLGGTSAGASSTSSAPNGSVTSADSYREAPVVAGTLAPGEDEPLTSSSSAASYSSSSSRPPKRKLHAVAPAGDGTVWIGHGSGMLRHYDWAGGKLQEGVAKRNEDWRRIYRHLSFYRPQTTLAAASSAAKAAGGGLKAGLQLAVQGIVKAAAGSLHQQADIDGNGEIDYSEFVAATMHLQRVDNEKNLQAAFDFFDSDRSGFIDIEELADALGADLTSLKEILAEVDTNNDGKISFDEFKVMMRKGTDLRGSLRHFSKSRSSLRALLKISEIDLAGGPTDGAPSNS